MEKKLFKIFLFVILLSATCKCDANKDTKTPAVAVTRTELKVSRSLDPDKTQTLDVVTKDGGIAQLIVKKRDSKSTQQAYSMMGQQSQQEAKNSQGSKAVYTNWTPVGTTFWSNNNNDKGALENSNTRSFVNEGRASETKKVSNIIDSDIIPFVPSVPRPITIRSDDIYVKDAKKSRSVKVDFDGIPLIQGVRVPDDEMDKIKTWRNARVINGELYPYENGYKPPAAIPIGELVYASKPTQTQSAEEASGVGPFTKEDNLRMQGLMNLDNFRPNRYNYIRFDSFGPFTREDNIKLADSKLIDLIKEINEKEAKKEYNNRKYRSYNENPSVDFSQQQMQRRMLQYPSYTSYPNSALYSSAKLTKLSPVNFNEGVRTPVLQYAHPELGVQPAKIAQTQEDDRDFNNYEIKPNRNLEQSSYSPNSIEYYKKDVLNYPYGSYYIKPKPEQPFWLRFTETIKDNVQNGFERMQQLTRPVFEPLVEASQKIYYNLGLSPQQEAQKKVGILAPAGTSVILPAIGLVAGGAALGLGAAAVGRFLENNDMRSYQSYPQNLNPEQDNIVMILEDQNFGSEYPPKQHRSRRSSSDDNLQNLQGMENSEIEKLSGGHLWTDTPCSKRLFCDVMVKQSEDNVVLMEKKMNVLLSMFPFFKEHPEVIPAVSTHLEDVMEAVRSKDCSRYVCRRRILI